jgi:hypothetical protein
VPRFVVELGCHLLSSTMRPLKVVIDHCWVKNAKLSM